MSHSNAPWELGELIILAVDGSISKEQFAVLNDRLRSDPEARRYYREFITTSVALGSTSSEMPERLPQDESGEELDPKLWGALAEDESHAHVVATEHPKSTAVTAQERANIILHKPSRMPLYAALTAAAILILLMGYIYIVPLYMPARSFITLVASSGAKWVGGLTTEAGSPLPKGRLALLEGSATIEVRKGAQITLQGGTELSIESNKEVYLAGGTVSSSITTKDGLGFAVRTANAIVKDLGTEFIVTVLPNGRTEVRVIKGHVELIPLTGQADTQEGQTLSAGQSGRVDPQGDMVTSASPQSEPPVAFIIKDKPTKEKKEKQIKDTEGTAGPAKFIDLADIIGGGDGFGNGMKTASISLVDGTLKEGFVFRLGTQSAGGYLRCPAAMIDGVFVPGAGGGPCVVSSTGTIFRESPVTSGMFGPDICNSSQITDQNGTAIKLHLQGRNWSTAPAIYMHSNSGITFDLDKIRAAYSLMDITMFSCRYSQGYYDDKSPILAWVGVYILVDGQKRFEKSTTSSSDEPEDIRIRLADKDRFLTLIVTDGSDGKLVNDDCLFVKPTVHVRAKHKN
jgi:hypothetical protein